MCADRDMTSPTGLKALLGHLLHVLPSRLFQLVRAIWTFMVGPWAPSALSLLPSGWLVHRSVQAEELPCVLEALGLHSGSWERLEDCYDELGQETGLAGSWKEFSSSQDLDSFDLAIEELTTWQKAMIESNFKVFFQETKLASWEDLENECRYGTSVDYILSSTDLTHNEKNGSPLPGVTSCAFHVKSDEVLTWLDENNDHGKNAFVDFPIFDNFERSPGKDVHHIDDFIDIPSQDNVERSPRKDVHHKNAFVDFTRQDNAASSPKKVDCHKNAFVIPSQDDVKRSPRKDDHHKNAFVEEVEMSPNHHKNAFVEEVERSPNHHKNAFVEEGERSPNHHKNAFVDFASKDEVERSPRFLQQNQVQEVQEHLTSKHEQDVGEIELTGPHGILASIQCTPNLQLALPVFESHQCQFEKSHDQSELFIGIDLSEETIQELARMDEEFSSGIQELDTSDIPQHNCPPSPEKDQGYHSLEDWQCLAFTQYIQTTPMETPETCESDGNNALSNLFQDPSVAINHQQDDQKDEIDSDLGDVIPMSVPICANKHIGYILGTVVSDDEVEDLSSDEEDEESDDGFDSEGSLSSTDSETSCPEEAVSWNSFGSSDPYSLQNFTASLQTGSVTREALLPPQDPPRSDDEESWCDSEAESDSEEDSSADEEENLKLWNAFLKSEDPYNPFHFKALVQSTDRRRQSPETSSKKLEITCRNRLDLPPCQEGDPKHLPFKDGCMLSLEKRTRPGHKKVTFLEKVTVYMCDEEERKGHWEELARDRCRFQRRIQETEAAIGHCLSPTYRRRVWQRMQEKWDS